MNKTNHPRLDLTGQVFERLAVVTAAPDHVSGNGLRRSQWACRCTCGNELVVSTNQLRQGSTRSCGCLQRERAGDANRTHGLSQKHPLWHVWGSMRKRCLNPRCVDYPDYGGRGIVVCERWSDFAAFVEDMGARPTPRHSLDRRDNDKGYTKDNCRWATSSEQARNKRTSCRVTAFGETKTIVEWSEDPRCSITEEALSSRLRKGWDVEEAITGPAHSRKVTNGSR